jgi:hypothetical protein
MNYGLEQKYFLKHQEIKSHNFMEYWFVERQIKLKIKKVKLLIILKNYFWALNKY